ncbi:MAG: anion permease [Desulfovibrionaceae bacterium]|nr:anion permease [Desulfovibrionaceae bacterium]MBF0512838.1 anion permease [Desulfovibrionaceae bacterium]
MKSLSFKAVAPIVIGLAIWLLPVPEGLTQAAWSYFALFVAVVATLILEPIPAAAAGFIGVTLAAALLLVPANPPAPPKAAPAQTVQAKPAEAPKAAEPAAVTGPAEKATQAGPAEAAPAPQQAETPKAPPVKPADAIRWALSGFSNGTVWLIFIAFMFAMGYDKTGLGKRIALLLVKGLGKKTLGLGYAVAFADLALAPFMPSNTARSGGTIFPIIKNIPGLYGSTPDNEPRKIGGYLMWTALATTCVTSSMFITALAPNLLALQLAEKTAKITFAWGDWFMNFLPVGVILFALTPWLAYLVYPPAMKESAGASKWAGDELTKMGPVGAKEWTMLGIAVAALVFWIVGAGFIDATTVAMGALSLMLLAKVISWDDLLSNKQAWNVLIWFGTLVALADGLGKVGFLTWFATKAAAAMAGFSPLALVVGLVAVFFLVHYLFASLTAHTTALLPVFLASALGVPGVPMKALTFLLCASLGLMGIITPFATGPSPIYYGSGYIKPKDFWLLGLVFGLVYLAVFLGVGVPWFQMLNP